MITKKKKGKGLLRNFSTTNGISKGQNEKGSQRRGCHIKQRMLISHETYFYTKQLFSIYLKFKIEWMLYMTFAKSGNPT